MQAGANVKLRHFGLFEHFRFGSYGDRHLDRDHVAAEAVTAACAYLGCAVHAEQIWVVGDTPLDIRCARAIGARVVAVATGGHTLEELQAVRPDLLLSDLGDASQMIAAMVL